MGVSLNGTPDIPLWTIAAFIGGLVLVAVVFILSFRRTKRRRRLRRQPTTNTGTVLAGATVDLHFVSAAKRPAVAAAIFNSGRYRRPKIDEGFEFYSMELTITPKNTKLSWDPCALAIVPAVFVPSDDASVRKYLSGLLSNETCIDGCFSPTVNMTIKGAQRLRLLFSIGKGVQAVKLASRTTCFGHIKLPAPAAKKVIAARGAPAKEPAARAPGRAALAH